MFGDLRSFENNASISSLPYLNWASLYFGPGEGGGTRTFVPLDKSRSLQCKKINKKACNLEQNILGESLQLNTFLNGCKTFLPK